MSTRCEERIIFISRLTTRSMSIEYENQYRPTTRERINSIFTKKGCLNEIIEIIEIFYRKVVAYNAIRRFLVFYTIKKNHLYTRSSFFILL